MKKSGLWWKILLCLVLLFFVFVAMLPTLVSFGGRGTVNGVVSGAAGTESQIQGLSLSWLGNQSIEGVKLFDKDGEPVFSFDKIEADVSLLSLVTGSANLGTTTVTGLDIRVILDEEGRSNLGTFGSSGGVSSDVSVKSSSDGPVVLPPDLAMGFKIVDAVVSIKQAGRDEVKVEGLNFSVDLKADGSPIQAAFDAAVSQAALKGAIRGKAEVKNLIGADGVVDETNAQLDISAETRDLPVMGLDRLFGLDGLLSEALGERLTLNVGAQGKLDEPKIWAQIDADRLKLSRLSGDIRDERFELDQPASLAFTATPGLVAVLEKNGTLSGLVLAQDATLNLSLQALSVPVDGNLATLVAKLNLVGQNDIVLQGDETLGRVVLSGLEANVDTQRLSQNIDLSLNAKLNVDGQDGSIEADAQIANLYNAEGDLDLGNARPNVNATVSKLPLGLVDRLAGLEGLGVAALGDRVEKLSVRSSRVEGGGGTKLIVSLKTPGLTLAELPVTLGDSLTLDKPVKLPYTLTPELLAKLAGPDAPIALEKPVRAELTLSRLSMKIPGPEGFDPAQAAISATLDLGKTALQVSQEGGALPVVLSGVKLSVNADALTKTAVDLQATANIDDGGIVASLDDLKVNLHADTGLNPDSTLGPIDATLQLKGEGLDSDLKLIVAEGFASAVVESGSTLALAFDTPRLRAWGVLPENGPALAGPASLTLVLDRTAVPLAGFGLDRIKAGVVADLTALQLSGDPKLEGTTLNDAHAKIAFDGSTGGATVQLNSAVQTAGQTGSSPLTIDAQLSQLLDAEGALQPEKAHVDATIRFADLPSAFVDALSGGGTTLADLAGPTLNLDAKANITDGLDADGRVDLRLRSDRLEADAALRLGESLAQAQPAQIRLTLTPESYALLTRPEGEAEPGAPDITLREDVRVEMSLDRLTGPGSALTDLAQLGFDATLTASPIRMHNAKNNHEAVFNNAKVRVTSTRLSEALNLVLNGDIGLVGGELGKLEVTGEVTNPLPAAGAAPIPPSVKLAGEVKGVSVHAADTLLNQDGLLVALLGDAMNLTLTADLKKMNGLARLSLDATHANADLPLVLTDGFATLEEDATAQLSIQESLGSHFISHPLLKQAVRSENPITVNIAKVGFRVPIEDFDLATVHIDKITVDPGKLAIRNAGLVRTLTELPNAIGRATRGDFDDLRNRKGELTAWFTPVDIRVADGKIAYSRMDMLLGKDYQVATWGELDLGNENGDMVLGLAERAMRRVYGVQLYKNDPDYVDQFPMRGPLATLGPDKKDLQLRLAFLTGGGVAAKTGGKAGEAIFSKVLEGLTKADHAINKKRKLVKPAPAPRLPFPWPAEVAAAPKTTPPGAPETQTAQTKPAPDQPKDLTKEEKLGRDIETGINILEGLFKKK